MDELVSAFAGAILGVMLGLVIAFNSIEPEKIGGREMLKIDGKWYVLTPAE